MNNFPMTNKITLNEGARDKALEMFMPYLEKRGINMSISQLKQVLLNKFVTEAGMHNLSLSSNFYLLGVSRYYFEGYLTSNKQLNILYPRVNDRFNSEICERLDALVGILRNAYVDSVGTKWEQPEDFGNLPLDKLLRKYNAKINKALGLDVKKGVEAEKPQVSDDYTAGNGYTYEILYSYNDAKKYKQYTEPGAWCITYGKQHYDGYVKRLKIHYVVFAQNGFEDIPRKPGPGFTKRKPHDAYGNSLICVLQSNSSPKPVYITSRWNHGSYDGTAGTEADHAYTPEEFLKVIGADESVLQRAFEQWKANIDNDDNKEKSRAELRADRVNALRRLKYAQMLINGGADPFSLEGVRFRPVFMDERGNNPKGLYYAEAWVNDSEYFMSIMDRKVIMFDQMLTTGTRKLNYTDKFVSFQNGNQFMIYDRIRHRFLDINGEYKFNHGTSQVNGGYSSRGYKYAILAMTGNQLALLNLETLKPVKARNGGAWFETIVPINSRMNSNRDYSGRIDLPYSVDGRVLKMIYDSASGEEYYFNTNTDSFVDVYDGIPETYRITSSVESQSPGETYLHYMVGSDPSTAHISDALHMFKNCNNGEIFHIGDVYVFRAFERCGNVFGFIPKNEYVAHYVNTNGELLEVEGKPITTDYGACMYSENGYVTISLSRWVLDRNGHVTYGNPWDMIYLYNPITNEFYHDDISGYVFKWYGNGYVYVPGAKFERNMTKEQAVERGILYRIPYADKQDEAHYQKMMSWR